MDKLKRKQWGPFLDYHGNRGFADDYVPSEDEGYETSDED